MDEDSKSKVIPLSYIRGLIVAQRGRCAITGISLDPNEVNADHIIPLSREDLDPGMGRENIWLVHKAVNAMKGTMTYDELVDMAKAILVHQETSRKLLSELDKGSVPEMTKEKFDEWVEANCDESWKSKSSMRMRWASDRLAATFSRTW